MQLGQRVEDIAAYRRRELGTTVSQPYISDSAMHLVIDVRWDNGSRSTVQTSKLLRLKAPAR